MADPGMNPSTTSATPANEADQQKPFRLMDLPPELRLHIYDFLIPEHTFTLHLGNEVYHEVIRNKAYPAGFVAFLRSCKLIHRELLPVFFQKSTLKLLCWDATTLSNPSMRVETWKPAGGLSNFTALRRAQRVEFSTTAISEEDHAQLARTIDRVLDQMDQCRGVKQLTLTFDFEGVEDGEEDQGGMDLWIDSFKSVQCPGTVVSQLIASYAIFDGRRYRELVELLDAKDVTRSMA